MRLLLGFLVLLVLALPGGGAARTEGGTIVAFVSAEDDDRLVALQPVTGRILGRIPVPDGPHNVAASPNGRYVLVTSPPAGKVTLVGARSLRVLKVFSGLAYPHDVEVGQDGRFAYVTEEGSGRVAVLDLVRRRVVSRVSVDPEPHDLALSDTLAWVTHGQRSSRLTVLELGPPDRPAGRPTVISRIPAGGPAHDIVHQPDTARVFVTYWNSGRLGAISGGVGRIRYRREVGGLVHHLAFDIYSGSRLWVTDHATGRLLIVSAKTARVLRSLEVGPSPHHVAIAAGVVVAVSHDTGTITAFYARGSGSLDGRKIRSTRVGRGLHGVALVFFSR